MHHSRRLVLILVLAFLVAACGRSAALDLTPFVLTTPAVTSPTPVTSATLWAVGDVATCRSQNDDAVAALLAGQTGTIALLGDVVYERGTVEEFRNCFDPILGPLKARIRPAVGNHEYGSRDAQPYFDYFGAAAGLPGQGWYSYELGAWHIVVLNSNCKAAGGCGPESPQYQWLKQDLAAHPSLCTLAYWHHPRWSSGEHGNFESMQPVWELLYQQSVDVVLNGHDHNYERFEPLDAVGRPDPEHGIIEFVVGTGGRSLRPLGDRLPVSATGSDDTYGVLQLELYPDRFTWRFVPVSRSDYQDQGSARCH
uniref:Alkaline phosphatase n=1 Tax=Thermomicrobium roseum TaxID=500 RepID=A0A7C5VYJ2_THERO